MAFLGKGKKSQLQQLAEILEIPITKNETISQLKNLITTSPDYDEAFVKEIFNNILSEHEKRIEIQEREKLQKAAYEERIARETKELEIQKGLKELEIKNNYELERLRIESGSETSSAKAAVKLELNLKKLIPEFDPKQTDISLYLILFERQCKRANINLNSYVAHLVSLMPMSVVQIIAREPEQLAEDYAHIKRVLLRRFKLSAEVFRQKFVRHEKKGDGTWKDYSFELRNYLQEWLDGLEITDFESLKELLVVDQLKKRASYEMRSHYLDKWPNFKTVSEIVEAFESYDNIRSTAAKFKEVKEERIKTGTSYKNKESKRDSPPSNTSRWSSDRERAFERRVAPRCYICNSSTHLRPNCPRLQKTKDPGTLNNLVDTQFSSALDPFTFDGLVNGQEVKILRDSGASLDICNRKFVRPQDFCQENIWVRQPLSTELICLPLAKVRLSGNFGTVHTKAGVCGNHLNPNRYILGNRTADLIKDQNGFDFFKAEQLNSVQTRAQAKKNREAGKKETSSGSSSEVGKETADLSGDGGSQSCILTEVDAPIDLPTQMEEMRELSLLKINKAEFIQLQKGDEELQRLMTGSSNTNLQNTNANYSIVNGILVKTREDKLGNRINLIVVPKILREKIKALCHEGTSSHLGCTKSKDKLARCFFWPNCHKDMDEYVRSCDSCQRAGKASDKKKAPLKLVPIITDVFTRLNIDACGPLPVTNEGHRYIITAICMSSKYPEAIPVVDISSVRVTDALLQIFSHLGFPTHVQVDQGTHFTSALTTDFFDKFGIKVSHSSVYHAQSNPVERAHRTMKRLLRALCVESGADWDKHLPAILLALRTVTHESTGYTPSELVYGRNLRTPEILLKEHWLEPREENDLVTEYMFKLINRLRHCRETAVERMEELQVKRKLWYDKNAVKREFKEGDLVLILATSRANKLSVQWIGPGTIRSKISDTNYLVEVPGRRERTQIYHINMLKPYYRRPEHINLLLTDNPPLLTSENDLDIPYLENEPTVFDFQEVIRTNELEKRLESFQITQLRALLKRFWKCFSNEPGLTNLVEHDITLINETPVRAKPYRTSHRQNEILKIEIQKMLKMGIIEIGESDYTSPMILVEVQGKEPRPCVDYRNLNKVIRTEYFPLPNIEERVEKVSSAKFITILDLAKGYWQIPLSKRAQRYATFCTNFGSYRPLRMSFGLKNAPYFFCKLMSSLLKGLEEFAVPYLDDIAVFSNTWEEHLKHLSIVLDRIKKANLTIKPAKCKFAQNHVKYLGHMVGDGFRSPAEAKIQCIRNFPTPKTKTQIRAFLGLSGYYAHYIPNFSVIAAPLTDALKGKAKKGVVIWNKQCEEAFESLKNKLTQKPLLRAPCFDREFLVQTDASNIGMGVVLSQVDDSGEEHPILYLSKKFSDVERRYSTTERECASIIFALKKLHYYLDGQKFKVITDHNPLVWLRSNAGSNPRLMRWSLAIQPYDFQVIHKSGKNHKNADCLSRSVIEGPPK